MNQPENYTPESLVAKLDAGRVASRYGSFQNNSLEVGAFRVSVQASDRHYCEPRTNEASNARYESFEVAVLDRKGNWVGSDRVPRFPGFDFEPDMEFPVAGYVPVRVLVDYLNHLATLPEVRV